MTEPVEKQTLTTREIALPHHYFNGFAINLSNADIGLVLLLNNHPVDAVNMSFSTAKTLAVKLGTMISDLEKATGHEIMDVDFLGKAIQSLGKKPA